MRNKNIISAFTLIELMVATVLAAILWTSAFSVITNIQLQQKKIVIAQSFYNESTILKDRIVQMVRNNTIDYDRHWMVEMRDSINGANWRTPCFSNYSGKTFNGFQISTLSDLTYPMTFYRDSKPSDSIEKLDRNYAGIVNNSKDLCTFAIPETRDPNNRFIFLINATRNIRQAVKLKEVTPGKNIIEVETHLGADTDNDGLADTWDKGSWAAGICYVAGFPALGIDTEDSCERSHDWKSITPPDVNITNMNFYIRPLQDPYLAWRSDEAQVHPHAHIFFSAEYQGAGFDSDDFPTLDLLTSASSRVYGDTRK